MTLKTPRGSSFHDHWFYFHKQIKWYKRVKQAKTEFQNDQRRFKRKKTNKNSIDIDNIHMLLI